MLKTLPKGKRINKINSECYLEMINILQKQILKIMYKKKTKKPNF